jgi:uncharacterized protein (DUF305 family)
MTEPSEPPAPTASGAPTDAAIGTAAADGPPHQHRISRTGWIWIAAAATLVLLLVGATLGLALSGTFRPASSTPGTNSVDAGFARDMIVHHDQGVLMAHYGEQNTTDDEIAVLAYDIGYTQTAQLGQMQGWLALWDLPEFSHAPHMAWMAGAEGHGGHDSTSASVPGSSASDASGSGASGSALMPGMATSEELARLASLSGVASDIYFLQLMIRHHEGGAPMMQYAAQHAESPVVRNFAGKMRLAQEAEVSVMTQMLAARGAEPLPAP